MTIIKDRFKIDHLNWFLMSLRISKSNLQLLLKMLSMFPYRLKWRVKIILLFSNKILLLLNLYALPFNLFSSLVIFRTLRSHFLILIHWPYYWPSQQSAFLISFWSCDCFTINDQVISQIWVNCVKCFLSNCLVGY